MANENVNDDGYIYRRLCLRDYLLQIFTLQTKTTSTDASFGDKSYWDSLYKEQKKKDFDWLGDWNDFKANLEPLITKDSKILNLGCGNSTIC